MKLKRIPAIVVVIVIIKDLLLPFTLVIDPDEIIRRPVSESDSSVVKLICNF
jgi:hypothetical protein